MIMASRLLSVIALWLTVSTSLYAQNTVYQPIPAGFDFPAPEATLLATLQAGDEAKLRSHGWMVFAGLTHPARPNDATSEAVWETWYSGVEVFRAGPELQGVRSLQREFRVPRQFKPRPGVADLQAAGESQLAFTLFNQEMKDHTRQKQLHLQATMQAINDGWTPQTPVIDRKVPDYPVKAMSLKIVWMLIKKQGVTPLPIWDEKPRVAHAPSQRPDAWTRVVAVDANRDTVPAGETRTVSLSGRSFPQTRVVPLKAFYHFALTAAQAAQANSSGVVSGAAAGDFMAVVAMHYTTKEIPDWVWATFWWHDRPNDGAFAQHRPAADLLANPWRNYLMDVAYDMDRPRESDGTANAVFNPWLEARFDNGANSNCMTCHQRAVWSAQSPAPDFLPVTRGAVPPNDPLFRNSTKADFLWSLLYEGNQ